MPLDIAFLQNLGMAEIMLWLLTFAVVYGVLSQLGVIKKKEVSALIGIVAGFFVLLAAPMSLISILSSMASGLLLIVLGIIVLLIFLEVAGIKHFEEVKDDKGVVHKVPVPFFTGHSGILAAVFIIIAILLFVGAGGLALLGWEIDFAPTVTPSIIILIVVILAVFWLIREG